MFTTGVWVCIKCSNIVHEWNLTITQHITNFVLHYLSCAAENDPILFSKSALVLKSQLQWKKSNRQNYKCSVVYLKSSNLRNLVYHCNVCAQRKFFGSLCYQTSQVPTSAWCGVIDTCIWYKLWGLSTLCCRIVVYWYLHQIYSIKTCFYAWKYCKR